MLYLAIDQHRKQLTVNLRNETGDVILKRQVSTEWKRVHAFFAELCERSQPEGNFVVILEVCGFNDWLLKLLEEYGCHETILIQPEKQSKKKTDRRDSNALGEILWVNRDRLLAGKKVQGIRRVAPPSERDAQDRQLTVWRQRLGQSRTRTINRVKRLLRKHNLEQDCPTKGIDTIKGKKWLAQVSLGPIDRREMDQLLAQWKLVDEQIEQVEAEIRKRQAENPTAVIIATIHGAGAYGSLALASRIGDIGRFPRSKSLASYWGLTPGCRNSGEATDRLGSITKQGSATARFILAQITLHVLRRDAGVRAGYLRIKKRRGAKIGRVAVMRRLATIIWHMVKYNEPYAAGGGCRAESNRRKAGSEGIAMRRLAADFRRHGKVSKGKKPPLARDSHQGHSVSLAHLGLAIPCRVASPQSPTPLHQAPSL
jgi:transposase